MTDKNELTLEKAQKLARHYKKRFAPVLALSQEAEHMLQLCNFILTMSEQLAAEQAKVKALQPYKDAYDAGDRRYARYSMDGKRLVSTQRQPDPTQTPVRVCKPVDGMKEDG